LSEFLEEKGYEVFGLIHDVSPEESLVTREVPFVQLIPGDLTDVASLVRACEEAQPDEIYNLGSQSAVDLSFKEPAATLHVTGLAPLNVLEILRISHWWKTCE
jgi:GDPmannose 4,6-dehydratase